MSDRKIILDYFKPFNVEEKVPQGVTFERTGNDFSLRKENLEVGASRDPLQRVQLSFNGVLSDLPYHVAMSGIDYAPGLGLTKKGSSPLPTSAVIGIGTDPQFEVGLLTMLSKPIPPHVADLRRAWNKALTETGYKVVSAAMEQEHLFDSLGNLARSNSLIRILELNFPKYEKFGTSGRYAGDMGHQAVASANIGLSDFITPKSFSSLQLTHAQIVAAQAIAQDYLRK